MTFSEKITATIKLFLNPTWFKKVLELATTGYLIESGWKNSFLRKLPVTKKGEAQPWLSVEANIFLKQRINSSLNIFEYGSGNSSIFFSKECNTVNSIEHDKRWYDAAKKDLQAFSNISLHLEENIDKYILAIVKTGKHFDLIIVDGVERNQCAEQGFKCLSEGGILVLDDSERPEYKPTFEMAKKLGFRELSVFGLALGINHLKSTTFFYRSTNVFNI